MISCTEFIPLYSELFKFLEERGGKDEVLKYWEYISDVYIAPRLGEEVKEKGLAGCFSYWSKSLSEEACDFTMVCDRGNGTFSIDMHKCPSKGMLLALGHMEPYHDYCAHCAVLYARQLEKYGIFPERFELAEDGGPSCYISYKKDAEKKADDIDNRG